MSERRRAEIAEKRARLAQLKQARQDREQSTRQQLQLAASSVPAPPREESRTGHDEIEQLLKGVGLASAVGSSTTATSPSASASASTAAQTPPLTRTSTPIVQGIPEPSSEIHAASPSAVPTVTTATTTEPEPTPVVSPPPPPPPKPKVVYDKSIQTTPDLLTRATASSSASVAITTSRDDEPDQAGREAADQLRARMFAELELERQQLDLEIQEEKRLAQLAHDEALKRGLPRTELDSIIGSPAFAQFLNDSTKVVQRALSESYDYLSDYTIADDRARLDADGNKQRVRLAGMWRDQSWGKGRSVTAIDWSPKYPELFVAAYNRNPMAINEPDGIVAVWNLHLLERPEFVFHAQSDVLSVCFSPFHPNLVIGGTYSGQILLWDTRSRSPNPVLKTPLSASGHTHPVYSLSMIGTQNAHSLVSASTDGTVCCWSLDMLARPQESLELVHPVHTKTDEVSITCLGFPSGETTSFWVGSEEGNVYSANRYDRAGAKAGLNQHEVYKGHSGPVTGISFHPVEGRIDLSDLFLTCGVDWTIRLWRAGTLTTTTTSGATSTTTSSANGSAAQSVKSSLHPNTNHATTTPGVATNQPLLSFEEADDYVYDVEWHPHHPALFASVDGAGKLNLWNLNLDTEVPIISTIVQEPTPASDDPPTRRMGSGPPRGGPAALNKVAWDKKEGQRCAVASSDGAVYVYEVSPDVVIPQEGEWEQMRRTCNAALTSSNGF
ncbi:dynein intermediate chain [Sporobolomyces koalae]|uniref:dynein intermediate chain n=1 Tax=Sporobolomyces koalae TaxID=500713 RepID=UPI003173114F